MSILSFLNKATPKPIWNFGANIYHSYLKNKYLNGKRPFVPGESSKAKKKKKTRKLF